MLLCTLTRQTHMLVRRLILVTNSRDTTLLHPAENHGSAVDADPGVNAPKKDSSMAKLLDASDTSDIECDLSKLWDSGTELAYPRGVSEGTEYERRNVAHPSAPAAPSTPAVLMRMASSRISLGSTDGLRDGRGVCFGDGAGVCLGDDMGEHRGDLGGISRQPSRPTRSCPGDVVRWEPSTSVTDTAKEGSSRWLCAPLVD